MRFSTLTWIKKHGTILKSDVSKPIRHSASFHLYDQAGTLNIVSPKFTIHGFSMGKVCPQKSLVDITMTSFCQRTPSDVLSPKKINMAMKPYCSTKC